MKTKHFIFILIPFIFSCATTSRTSKVNSAKPDRYLSSKIVVSENSKENASQIGTEKKLFILPVLPIYESIITEERIPMDLEAIKYFFNSSVEILQKKGFRIVEESNLGSDSTFNNILINRIKLFQSSFDTDLLNSLKSLGERTENTNVLVLLLRVKVGPGASWNSYTGAITSSSSYSIIKAIILEPETGKPLWKNEVQLRQIPKANNTNYRNSILVLFNNLITL